MPGFFRSLCMHSPFPRNWRKSLYISLPHPKYPKSRRILAAARLETKMRSDAGLQPAASLADRQLGALWGIAPLPNHGQT